MNFEYEISKFTVLRNNSGDEKEIGRKALEYSSNNRP